ncbi:MAG: D-alanyl-D-alanine carboxypeptidase family protein [Acidimicrobiales bacterium]
MGLFALIAIIVGGIVLVRSRPDTDQSITGQAPLRDHEVGRLFDQPLPGLSQRRSTPTATGNARADARIRDVAFARGYQLRVEALYPMGTYQGRRLQQRAIDDLVDLQAAMFEEVGVRLTLTSAHRSAVRQRGLFLAQINSSSLRLRGRLVTNNEIALGLADDVLNNAMLIAAPPGFSRHHTGLTIDVSSQGFASFNFANSTAYRWLTENRYSNAMAYGWVASYPPGAAAQGPNPEPWEWVWIGRDAAECAAARTCATGGVDAVSTGVIGWAINADRAPIGRFRLLTANGTRALKLEAVSRYDVAVALGLTEAEVGFAGSQTLPASARWACVEAQTSAGGPWNPVGCMQAG